MTLCRKGNVLEKKEDEIGIKAVIFDFDGTLADMLPVCFLAFESVFKKFDHREGTSEEIKAMFRPSETGFIRKNLNNNHNEAIELYYKIYRERHENLVQKNEDINTLLRKLKTNGYKPRDSDRESKKESRHIFKLSRVR